MYLKPTVGEETCFSHSGKSCWELSRREAWPRHQTSMPRPATMSLPSSPGVEEVKPRQGQTGAMGETPRAAATELFWGDSETCEEKIQSHLRSLRKVLAEFLDWRASEEKRRLDYLVKDPAAQMAPWVFPRHHPQIPPAETRGILSTTHPCKAPNPVGAAGADPGQETSGAERRRIGAEFERLRRFLAEKERAVLGRLAELDAAFEAAQVEKSSRVAEGIVRLHGLIGQLEAQDTGSVLSSWSEMRLHLPSGLPAELHKSLSSCHRQRDALREALEQFQDMGRPETKPGAGNSPSAEGKAKASPEPGAGPLPQLLADRRSVRWCEEEPAGAREHRRGQEPAGGYGGGAAPGRCRTRTR